MINIIDEQRVARMQTVSRRVSLAGLAFLIGGLLLSFTDRFNSTEFFFIQTVALLGGWGMAQVGIYYAHRYVSSPRPDEVLAQSLRKAVPQGRLYHYVLPVPHVLLTAAGPIVLIAKYQGGEIWVENDKWKQSGVGMGKWFGQQGVGNPTQEAYYFVDKLDRYIRKNAPDLEAEFPIGAIIVFTQPGLKELDLEGSSIPAMHASKLKKYLKKQGLGEPLPAEVYERLREMFDEAAGKLV
ncbi:MAG TPA: hypothetical protein VLL52_25620 [Anaerolineae bacterium]|nr:hypothetical protein [Anaerolineae bacterium]